jgi:ketosteroid isomerase-like protein
MVSAEIATNPNALPRLLAERRSASSFAVIAVASLVISAIPVGAFAEGESISNDESLNASVQRYRNPASERGTWRNPCIPETRARAAGELEKPSGDVLLMRSVAVYTRALLDRGGWENPFVSGTSNAAGDSLVEVHGGEGVTTVDAVAAASRGAAVPGSAQIEVMRRRIAATNSRDFAAWEALHAPGACRTTPELQGSLCGRAAMRAGLEALTAAFPDYALELVEASGGGDRLAVRMHASGTHSGTLILSDGTAVPPTDRHIAHDWVALVTFDTEGRIERIDEFYDEFVLLFQLGLAQPTVTTSSASRRTP